MGEEDLLPRVTLDTLGDTLPPRGLQATLRPVVRPTWGHHTRCMAADPQDLQESLGRHNRCLHTGTHPTTGTMGVHVDLRDPRVLEAIRAILAMAAPTVCHPLGTLVAVVGTLAMASSGHLKDSNNTLRREGPCLPDTLGCHPNSLGDTLHRGALTWEAATLRPLLSLVARVAIQLLLEGQCLPIATMALHTAPQAPPLTPPTTTVPTCLRPRLAQLLLPAIVLPGIQDIQGQTMCPQQDQILL